MAWTIRINSGSTKTPEQLGIIEDSMTDTRTSQAADILEFSTAADIDSSPIMDYGDTFRLYRDGVKYFEGTCTSNPVQGTADSEGINYTVAGPWYLLETTAYTQVYKTIEAGDEDEDGNVVTVDTPVYTSNVILFRGSNNNVINTSDTLVDIVDYAQSVCNLPVAIGQIPSSPVSPWSAKFQDNTISQAIQSVLRWHPGSVTWFDYSKSTPTLNITTRADAPTYSADIDNGNIVDLSITPRGDLQPAAVAVHYRSTNQVDGNSYPKLTTDIFPEGSDFKAQGVVNVSIDLRGSNVQRQYQSARTTSIPKNTRAANNLSQRVFWRRHFPRLADNPFDDAKSFEIENYEVKLATDAPDPVPYDPLTRGARRLKQSFDVDSYPRELLDGSIDEWMGNGTIRTAQLAISARCKISTAIYNDLEEDDKKLFPGKSAGYRYGNLEITVTGTNAFTKNYSRITNYEQGETAPTGLAQTLYTDLSQLQYEGAMTIVDEEVGNDSIMGKVINVAGGKSAWAGMQAVVQSVSHSYSDGATSVTFGPPEQLAPQDLIELLGYGRELKYTYISSTEDATNQQSEGKTVGAYTSPNSNATWLGGGSDGDVARHNFKVGFRQSENIQQAYWISGGRFYPTPLMDKDLAEFEREGSTIVPDLSESSSFSVYAFAYPDGQLSIQTLKHDQQPSGWPGSFSGGDGESVEISTIVGEGEEQVTETTHGFYKRIVTISGSADGGYFAFNNVVSHISRTYVCEDGIVKPVIISI